MAINFKPPSTKMRMYSYVCLYEYMSVHVYECVSVYKSNVCFGDSTGHVFEFN